jgi:hypothetical protein
MLSGLRLLLVGFVFAVAACANPPVQNVTDAPLGFPPETSLEQVQQAILMAGVKRDWKMRVIKPGLILANHSRSNHYASVEISFTTQTFSIAYNDSVALQYDGESIHPTYNRWIDFLQQDIQEAARNFTQTSGSGPGTVGGPAPQTGEPPVSEAAPGTEAAPAATSPAAEASPQPLQ